MSQWFTDILNMELEAFELIKEDFLKHHSEKDYRDIVDGSYARNYDKIIYVIMIMERNSEIGKICGVSD